VLKGSAGIAIAGRDGATAGKRPPLRKHHDLCTFQL
jgi:hypothetical protein